MSTDSAQQLPAGSVVAVIVTRHRRELLAESLKVIGSQTRLPDHLVVVDNGPDQSAEDVVADCPIPSTYIASQRNLGGAGGFALGMLTALSLGAEWVWLGDDDGRPADEQALETLLEVATKRRLAAVSPVVVNIDTPDKLAFPLRRGLTWKRRVSELGAGDFLPGIASLFNGALFRASTLDVVGVPDYRLFFRGDEVEIHRRVLRSGLPFGTTLKTRFLHPDGSAEFKPMLGGRFHAQDPSDANKRYYTYRNRGYLLSQPGMRKIGALEVIRFGLYFVGQKRDPKAFKEWLRLVRQGQREQFFRR
ncbi:glycosyltransferase family 2 protein [Saccharopolyspora indica]|uniref:Rhamnopyranosyl-N-acetylglucosaminyl-diphospho-decaprenol beta-1,3/1,4-galactofuranosyltransferase n=1 Tax=Saccharopolyspora antimicrobica TaxID=455193 RepID=A0A1I4WZC0_9PSEU|nr:MULTISPECIES: glycosyltransferase family 2 protein [Saccharopolyspora]MDA3645984.1 glycosyltransferase family 2 protein [Saccharopolyspora indica]RKT84207.1 rhamnopyranosyl-N-acetylglucosaminyl-diphospho-decaprenol beta-1,3/1,4-galactofuranosyltransferase [Saccharopolyspora antimicrobica]SFN18496.1 rhamnopyranosyl-N-acetylglucosaminyl-diphospho-decaprenol beta-1,3/1,4-galactofuranosyltransferase [Saccharopolyspora antimicrobica]